MLSFVPHEAFAPLGSHDQLVHFTHPQKAFPLDFDWGWTPL